LKRITSPRREGQRLSVKVEKAAAGNSAAAFLTSEDESLCQLRLEYESRMAILVAFFPDSHDLIYRNIADVVVFVAELKHTLFNFHYLAAETGRAGANHVNFAIDHF
jgi:hypothetical protein